MEIKELVEGQKVEVEIMWGDQKIEFSSELVAKDEKGIWVLPYIHRGRTLELNIDTIDDVVCSLYALNGNNTRVCWKNLELKTLPRGGAALYYLVPHSYNRVASNDDRRRHERIVIHKQGKVYDKLIDQYAEVMIHDISDIGISFYAPPSFQPQSNQLTVYLKDYIDDREFDMKIQCSISRMQQRVGTQFHGCRIIGENREYTLYGCLKRMRKRAE